MAINWKALIEIRDFRNGDWFWVNKSVWNNDKLSSSDKIIYGTLAYFANQQQTAWPALETIAHFSGISERQTYRSLKILVNLNYIFIKRGGGRGHPNQYQLLKIKGDIVAPLVETLPSDTINPDKETLTNSTSNNNDYNKKNNNTITKVIAKKEYGNTDINLILEALKEKMQLPKLDLSEKVNRQYAQILLKQSRTGVQGVLWLINLASEDPWFRNHTTSLRDIWSNQVKIVAQKRKEASKVYDATNL